MTSPLLPEKGKKIKLCKFPLAVKYSLCLKTEASLGMQDGSNHHFPHRSVHCCTTEETSLSLFLWGVSVFLVKLFVHNKQGRMEPAEGYLLRQHEVTEAGG